MLDAEKEMEVETVTEQEAIEILDELGGFCSSEDRYKACHMAIKALEEVKQYREIGTVEEIMHANSVGLAEHVQLEKYMAIGTTEECRENKEFLEFLYNRINPNDMEQYLSMYNCSDEKIN